MSYGAEEAVVGGAVYGERYLDATEREALVTAGYGGHSGLGTCPALLVVDVTFGFCGPPRSTLLDAVKTHPLASGESAWRAVASVQELVAAARRHGLPVVFTRPAAPGAGRLARTRWDDKNRRQQEAPADAFDLVPETGVRPDDVVLEKEGPSAFFGTPLTRWLTGWRCDSLIVCGGTTSGCVRATVVDAFSWNLKVAVAADACFDRVRISHETALFDMGLKYADVRSSAEIQSVLGAPSSNAAAEPRHGVDGEASAEGRGTGTIAS
jgi:maleamate amidohydrolase